MFSNKSLWCTESKGNQKNLLRPLFIGQVPRTSDEGHQLRLRQQIYPALMRCNGAGSLGIKGGGTTGARGALAPLKFVEGGLSPP